MKRLIILLVLASVLVGCSNVYSAEEGYRMAIINHGFPVPKNASEIRPEACTGEIAKSAKYRLKGISNENGEPPADYLEEIEAWGWVEQEERRLDNVRFFEKDGKIISLVFQKNVFDVFELTDAISKN